MFSGIIQATADIKKTEKKNGSYFLTIAKPAGWRLRPGDSLATDGVCLTVVTVAPRHYVTELMPATLKRTSFGQTIPAAVNLEPSLRLSDRLDGHLVMGHVDAVGRIKKITKRGRSWLYQITYPARYRKFIAAQGSVAVDGISLTVAAIGRVSLTVSIMDYTYRHTTLKQKKAGRPVNLEFDVIARYLSQLIKK